MENSEDFEKSIEVTLSIHGEKYLGKIKDIDALLFMSAVFDDEENVALKQGKFKEAGESYQKRADQRLKELREQGRSDEEALNEWALYLLNRVNLYWGIQDLIAWRITKRFKGIPPSLISWSREEGGDIFLGIIELLQVLTGLIAAALQVMKTFESNNIGALAEKEKVESLQEEPAPTPEPEQPSTEPTPIAAPVEVVQPTMEELGEEIVHIEAMLEQRKKQLREQKSATLEAVIVQQRL